MAEVGDLSGAGAAQASDVNDLMNQCLGLAGANLITDIDEGSPNANHCKRLYRALRRSLIRMSHWNFAKIRVTLTPDVDATTGAVIPPNFEFNYQYAFPTDPPCLKIIEYNGALVNVNIDPVMLNLYEGQFMNRWKVEHGKLLSNDGQVLMVYLGDIENPQLWDTLYYQTIKYWLSSELCLAIPKDVKKAQTLFGIATTLFMPLALSVNGQEGSVEAYIQDDLTWGR